MRKIAVRLDDITPDMDWEKFHQFELLFEKHGITPLIGVVPDNQDDNLKKEQIKSDFWEYVKELQHKGYVIAMHGYQHIYTTAKGGMFPLNNFSEFAGIPYEQQLDMLQQGKTMLSENGIETDIFMAPAHSYDKNTLKALKECGFRGMTDGFGSKPYHWNQMTFYPISFRLKTSLKKKNGYTTMVIHANTVSENEMEKYSKIFDEHKEDLISYSEYLDCEVKNRNLIGRAGEWALASLKFFLRELKG